MKKFGGLKLAGPIDPENPNAAFADTSLHPFTKEDWYGWAGAEKFPDGSEPLIGEVEVKGWPEESFEGGGPLTNAVIIVDAQGISLNGTNGAYADWTHDLDKEALIAKAKQMMAQQPIDVQQLKAQGWDEVNFPNDARPWEEPQVPIEASKEAAGKTFQCPCGATVAVNKLQDLYDHVNEHQDVDVPKRRKIEEAMRAFEQTFENDKQANAATDVKPDPKKAPKKPAEKQGAADDMCEACGKEVANRECAHGILCDTCDEQVHGGVGAPCDLEQPRKSAGKNWDPETKSYDEEPKCPRCGGSGTVSAPAGMAKDTFQGAGKCPECKGSGKVAAKKTASARRAEYYPGNDFVRIYEWDGEHVGNVIQDMPKAEFQAAKKRGEWKYAKREIVHSSPVYIYYSTFYPGERVVGSQKKASPELDALMDAYNRKAVENGDMQLAYYQKVENPYCDFHDTEHPADVTMFYTDSSSAQSASGYCEAAVREYVAEPGQVGPSEPTGPDAAHRHVLGTDKTADGRLEKFKQVLKSFGWRYMDTEEEGDEMWIPGETGNSYLANLGAFVDEDRVAFVTDGYPQGTAHNDMELRALLNRFGYQQEGRKFGPVDHPREAIPTELWTPAGPAKTMLRRGSRIQDVLQRPENVGNRAFYEANAEHAGAVCGECGKTVTNGEYSKGESRCCKAGVVPEEEYGKTAAEKRADQGSEIGNIAQALMSIKNSLEEIGPIEDWGIGKPSGEYIELDSQLNEIHAMVERAVDLAMKLSGGAGNVQASAKMGVAPQTFSGVRCRCPKYPGCTHAPGKCRNDAPKTSASGLCSECWSRSTTKDASDKRADSSDENQIYRELEEEGRQDKEQHLFAQFDRLFNDYLENDPNWAELSPEDARQLLLAEDAGDFAMNAAQVLNVPLADAQKAFEEWVHMKYPKTAANKNPFHDEFLDEVYKDGVVQKHPDYGTFQKENTGRGGRHSHVDFVSANGQHIGLGAFGGSWAREYRVYENDQKKHYLSHILYTGNAEGAMKFLQDRYGIQYKIRPPRQRGAL